MGPAGVDSGFRRNDGWGAARTGSAPNAPGYGFRLAPERRLRESAIGPAGMDSGLRRNDGWGAARTGSAPNAPGPGFRLAPE